MLKVKIKSVFKITPHRVLAFLGLVLLAIISLSAPLSAQTFTQGFMAKQSIQRGMIVRLAEDTDYVEIASLDKPEDIYGVAVDANDAAVTLSGEEERVFVATIGTYEVLVSTQNGIINEGDFVALSAISGIGMKVDSDQPIVVGRALATFDGKDGLANEFSIKTDDDQTQKVLVGRIPVDLGVAANSLQSSVVSNVPKILQELSASVAGKKVDPIKVYVAVVMFIISTALAGTIMYSGVRSGFIAIGRNPLSKKMIGRTIFQVIVVGIIIFITGLFGVYLLLRA